MRHLVVRTYIDGPGFHRCIRKGGGCVHDTFLCFPALFSSRNAGSLALWENFIQAWGVCFLGSLASGYLALIGVWIYPGEDDTGGTSYAGFRGFFLLVSSVWTLWLSGVGGPMDLYMDMGVDYVLKLDLRNPFFFVFSCFSFSFLKNCCQGSIKTTTQVYTHV